MTSSFSSKYKLLEKIGEGSFSDVVKCVDKITGVPYAAKRLKKVFKNKDEIMNSAEVVAMQKLSWHPNVLHMIEYHYEYLQGKAVFIFELMDMSLYDVIKNKKRCISESRAKNYLYQILNGLDHLHRNGLFHRDVKPENVLIKFANLARPCGDRKITQREMVKLADLGSIREIYSMPPYTEYISTRWYRSPECLLTVGYYGSKMDIWATGCVFYEMLTLKPLFPGTNELDQLAKIHHVLGTPSQKLLSKLKKKSRNCIHFTRQQGTGLQKLTPNLSHSGLIVLKLMIQYDPDQRINVKRLLQNRYFNDGREREIFDKQKFSPITEINRVRFPQIIGDYKTAPNLDQFIAKTAKKAFIHHQKASGVEERKHNKIGSSKTTVHILKDLEPLVTTRTNKLQPRPSPLVEPREMMSWGINPYMLKPRLDIHLRPEITPRPIKKRPMPKSKLIDEKHSNAFRKTTSDLPQLNLLNYCQGIQDKSLKSKSFNLPWRKAGSTKLNGIEVDKAALRRIKNIVHDFGSTQK